jgi:hypothetical protein
MNGYLQLADRLDSFATLLHPQKIAGHYSQAKIMREAASAIRDLEQQLTEHAAREKDARQIVESNRGAA